MKNIILFGKMGAGKETAAKMLQDIYFKDTGDRSCIVKLTTKLDSILEQLKGEMPTRTEKQEFGQFMRRLLGENVWNRYLAGVIKYKHINMPVIIEDGRQENEFDFWTRKGFIAIGVIADEDIRSMRVHKRDGYDQRERMQHETELSVDKILPRCHVVVNNNGDKEALYNQLQYVYKSCLKR